MNKNIFILFLFSWIGYFGLVADKDYVTKTSLKTDSLSVENQEKVNPISTVDFSSYLSQTEYRFQAENHSFPSVKNTSLLFIIHGKQIEHHLNSYFKRFTLFSANKLFSSLKIAILFPFHCFW